MTLNTTEIFEAATELYDRSVALLARAENLRQIRGIDNPHANLERRAILYDIRRHIRRCERELTTIHRELPPF